MATNPNAVFEVIVKPAPKVKAPTGRRRPVTPMTHISYTVRPECRAWLNPRLWDLEKYGH